MIMTVDLKNFVLFAIALYIGYYIYCQNDLVDNQKTVIDDQYNLIETQRAYIIEINKMLGINVEVYWYRPKQQEDSPLNLPPI